MAPDQKCYVQLSLWAHTNCYLGLYLLDAGSNANLRVATEVSSITTTGFQIKMNKWADTVLYGGKVSWMACGK